MGKRGGLPPGQPLDPGHRAGMARGGKQGLDRHDLRRRDDLATFADALAGSRATLVFASGPGDDSLVEEADGRGIFTSILLSGLSGPADQDGDGALSMEEISTYLITQTKESSAALGKTSAPFLQLHPGSWLPMEAKPVVRKKPAKPREDEEDKGEGQ